MTQGERIKEIRTALGLTLEKFGDKLGVTKVAISNIEKGNRNLTEQMIKAICREYNVNYDYIIYGTGEKFNDLPQTILDELCAQYDLDELDRQIVDIYISLPKQLRDSVKEHIRKTYFKEINKKNSSSEKPIQSRAAHANPEATKEQMEADNALMESDYY